jgi:uncharacterized protein involved in exopolysaccharide biosynthesis
MTQRDILLELSLNLMRRRWLIASVFIVIFVLVCGFTYLQYPLYKATVGILVQENPRQQPIFFSDLSTPALPNQKREPAKNIVEIARSADLARHIVDQYELDARLERRDNVPENFREKFWNGVTFLINSPIYLLEAVGILDESEPNYRSKATKNFREDNLDIFHISDTELVTLSIWEESPSLAVSIANTMSELLIDQVVTQAQTKASVAFQFAKNRASVAANELQAAEIGETEFRQQHNLVDIDQQREFLLARLNALQTRYADNIEEQQRLYSRKARLENQLEAFPEKILSTTVVAGNPLVPELKSEKYRTEVEIAFRKSEWGSANRGMIALKDKVAEIQKASANEDSTIVQSETFSLNLVHQDIMTQIVRVDADLEALSQNEELLAQITAVQAELSELLANEIQLNNLERQRKTQEQLYMTLKEKVVSLEAQRVNNLSEFDIQIFENPYLPENAKKAYPKWDISIIVAVIGGLGLSVLLALLINFVDDTYTSSRSLERDFEGLLLGSVPLSTAR